MTKKQHDLNRIKFGTHIRATKLQNETENSQL